VAPGVLAPVGGMPSPGWPYASPTLQRAESYGVHENAGTRFATFDGSHGYDISVRRGSLEDRATGPLGGGLPRDTLLEADAAARGEDTVPEDEDAVLSPGALANVGPNGFTVQLNVPDRSPITVPIFPSVPPVPLAPVDVPAPADTIAAQVRDTFTVKPPAAYHIFIVVH